MRIFHISRSIASWPTLPYALIEDDITKKIHSWMAFFNNPDPCKDFVLTREAVIAETDRFMSAFDEESKRSLNPEQKR